MAADGKLVRIYPLGSNTELAATESGKLYIGSVTETGSGASANIGKITTITSTPGAGVYDDVFAAGDYLIIRHQQYGMLGVGQWIKVESVASTGASTVLTLEDNTAEFYSHLNSSGADYTGQTSVGITFEKVMGWGVRSFTQDQVDDSIVPEIMNRWGSYTKGTASHDDWKGHIKPLAGTSNTANYNLLGTVGERYRSPDVVGDHPVANNITTTSFSLEQCAGTKPFNGAANAGHVDDFDSVLPFLGIDETAADGQKLYQIANTQHQSVTHGIVPRCNAYFSASANTVGSYHIGTAAGDSDTSSWHDETWYTDTIIASSGTANVAYHLYRKESGAVRAWSGTRLLSNANTEARAANCVLHWTGANADYIVVGNYPRAATDEVIFKPVFNNSNSQAKEATAINAFGHSAVLQGTADDAGLQLYWIEHQLKSSSYIGQYDLVSGNTAPGTGTWAFCGNVYDKVTTIGDVIYSQGYEGIYSMMYEGIYSTGYEGIYSAGFTGIYSQGFAGGYTGAYAGGYAGAYAGGYTLTYGSSSYIWDPNPQVSSEGPTYSSTFSATYSGTYSGIYSGTYSSGFEGIYSSGFTGIYSTAYGGIYSGQYAGIYSNQYTGTTVFTVLEEQNYSLWKRTA